jgi:hypothetical protein
MCDVSGPSSLALPGLHGLEWMMYRWIMHEVPCGIMLGPLGRTLPDVYNMHEALYDLRGDRIPWYTVVLGRMVLVSCMDELLD